jgi:hypothetical protein
MIPIISNLYLILIPPTLNLKQQGNDVKRLNELKNEPSEFRLGVVTCRIPIPMRRDLECHLGQP